MVGGALTAMGGVAVVMGGASMVVGGDAVVLGRAVVVAAETGGEWTFCLSPPLLFLPPSSRAWFAEPSSARRTKSNSLLLQE